MKTYTEEQKAVLIAQKEKELEKLAKKELKPIVGRYLILLLVMVTLNFCVDIFGSNIHNVMKADALNNLLSGVGREKGFQLYENYALIFGAVVTIFLPFYKALTDKFGRKPFLIINTLLTGIGMGIMMLARSLIVYIIGFVISTVGYQGDVHQIFILESAPKHLRARFASATKAISVLCSSLIGVFKLVFQTEAVPESWRYVFIIPVAAALLVAILSCFFTQETEQFVENKKAALAQEIRVLRGEKIEKEERVASLSFKETIAFIFTHKQTRMLFIAACFFCAAMTFTKPYSLILEESGNADAIAIVTIVYPFIEGAFSLIGGFISDKFGRKVTVIANGLLFIAAYTLFILGFKHGLLPVFLLGIVYGLVSGGYWAGRDTLGTTMTSESVPTASRATIVGIFTMVTGFCNSIAGAALSNIPAIFHVDLSYTFMIGCDLLMLASVLFVAFTVKETKNNDLDTITGDEY